ncbi:uncharacterized protein LOC115920865 [Strongylocentrotus purpuratus]|uniref:Uncharacterized protein n=1 Tax=Strongylocentrotus purpuratus TaxID=7668 RepID=A0A7M7NDA5_STRPU|nr:uncharacterized protein LOC115920865 [Strongylocentrotus purpuratus]
MLWDIGLISASCAMPDSIPNTITTLSNQTLDTGSYITWECSDGYMMDGLTNTVVWVCLDDGSWLGHIPICKDVECPSPPIAAYSELDPPLPETPVVNQTISYRCSSSEYTLLGSYLNRCLQDGIWENDPPVCQRTCSTFNTKRYSNLTCYRRRGSEEWDGSFDLCIDQGEILATVKDTQTQEFLVEFLRTFNDEANIWIGAREGRDWKWRKIPGHSSSTTTSTTAFTTPADTRTSTTAIRRTLKTAAILTATMHSRRQQTTTPPTSGTHTASRRQHTPLMDSKLSDVRNPETPAQTDSKTNQQTLYVHSPLTQARTVMYFSHDKYIERFFWQNLFPDSNLRDCIELSYQSGSAKYSWNPRSLLEENALLCQYGKYL